MRQFGIRPNSGWALACAAGAMSVSVARASEVTVQNDTFVSGGPATIEAGFAANESAAVWLTSPCDGDIVAVQIGWLSLSGGTGQTEEDSISIFNGSTFPTPGAALIN